MVQMVTKEAPIHVQESKKIIALDVDGTIADLATSWIKLVKERYGVELTMDQLTKYHMNELVPSMTREEFIDSLREIWRDYKNVKLVDMSIPQILDKVHQDYEIHIVTATVGTDDQIKEWLQINAIPYDKFVHVANSGEKKKEGADIYIDDYFKVAQQVAVLDKNVIIIKQPWSEIDQQVLANSHNKIIVAQTWVDIEALLLSKFLRK